MIKALLCSVLLALVGCVSVSPAPIERVNVQGEVRMPSAVTRPAYVSVRLYAQVEGQPRMIAQASYRVTALPVHFAFRLMPAQVAGEGLSLRSQLAWSEEGPVQARSWQPVVIDNDMKVQLGQLPCYPKCTVRPAATPL
ncbi:YscW family type III secretion system pilotin [Pseudomonas sp. NPDC087598]|uniref:YscW family type III secretion system pilotin n=1 Tax=Pseudomonas sp. NPDC087598 TaxID=3364440 RepID=UPI0038210D57